ncbi:hypothetical protein HNQ02_003374 [Flavobacterium sp. 7E]|uniref:hypothetical protein n=1 Tax=unclassified Flavobacterium TaxID=196869 RepID=UPI00156DD714|nr:MULTISPECIES: hypothetical protein [unclassified Flavobacterium]MBE0393649.1 hypothetical protein [Flavobacterium sp. PL002]NRS90430.1 hypothetical protein [Flavobacterium sp. 7E]
MKQNYLFLILFLLSITSSGQTKIDDLLSIKFPCEPEKKDTTISNIRFLSFNCDSYSLQRILIDSLSNDLNKLPSDLNTLKEFYLGTEKGFTKSMQANGYRLQNSSQFKAGNYLGQTVSYYGEQSKVIECRFLVLNEYLYTLTYLNQISFNEKDKNEFFNSIVVNSSKKPKQMLGNPKEYKRAFMLGQFMAYALFAIGIIYLIRYFKRK